MWTTWSASSAQSFRSRIPVPAGNSTQSLRIAWFEAGVVRELGHDGIVGDPGVSRRVGGHVERLSQMVQLAETAESFPMQRSHFYIVAM